MRLDDEPVAKVLPTEDDIPFVGRLASLRDTSRRSTLLTFAAQVEGFQENLLVLIDSGANNNFIRQSKTSLLSSAMRHNLVLYQGGSMTVRLADGEVKKIPRCILRLRVKFLDFDSKEELIELPLSCHYDIILGMPWLERHQPWIDWRSKEVGTSNSLLEERAGHDPASSRCFSVEATYGSTRSDQSVDAVTLGVDAVSTSSSHGEPTGGVGSQPVEVAQEGVLKVVHVQRTDVTDAGGAICPDSTCGAALASGAAPKRNARGARYARGAQIEQCSRGDEASHGNTLEVSSQIGTFSNAELCVLESKCSMSTCDDMSMDPPTSGSQIVDLPVMDFFEFLKELKAGEIGEICHIVTAEGDAHKIKRQVLEEEKIGNVDRSDGDSSFDAEGWQNLRESGHPLFSLLWSYRDVFPEEVPSCLPVDRGIRHEIDLLPGTKYCVTRQWPLPKEQVDVIDAFFAKRIAAGQVRESKSPHSSPTFCVRKATGVVAHCSCFQQAERRDHPGPDSDPASG